MKQILTVKKFKELVAKVPDDATMQIWGTRDDDGSGTISFDLPDGTYHRIKNFQDEQDEFYI